MATLANDKVGSIFTIPVDDWTAINKRVGSVLAVKSAEDILKNILPAYPKLLNSSILWKKTTFYSLIDQADLLMKYSTKYINAFQELDDEVKKCIGSDLPKSLITKTKALLLQLKFDTTPQITNSEKISSAIRIFLNDNVQIDQQMAKDKSQFGHYWANVSKLCKALEDALGLVVGEWSAIKDDLEAAVDSQINVDMAFIESLNIEAAIKSWKVLRDETNAFPSKIKDQEQYWNKIE